MKRISFLVLILALGGCSALHKQNVYQPLTEKSVYLELQGGDDSLIYQEIVQLLRIEGFEVETNYEATPDTTDARYGVVFKYEAGRQFGFFRSRAKVYDYRNKSKFVQAEYSYETDKATMTPVFESGRGEKVASLISGLWTQSAQ